MFDEPIDTVNGPEAIRGIAFDCCSLRDGHAMKRDMDLIRQILLVMEAHEDPSNDIDFSEVECSDAKLQYHLVLLFRAGFITGFETSASNSADECVPTGFTWAGHEFLDNIRSETVWKKVKQTVSAQVGSASLALIVELAKEEVKRRLSMAP